MNRPRLSFWQIWNMSFGFLGIQFGWGLQMGNMSAIYEKLGAQPDRIPILWLAAPLTGRLVQPIVGSLSDRTWGPLGRRRPYFLAGAILSSLALFVMPMSSSLWMAAGLLWILDASINVSMEPFRAFVADKLNDRQRTTGEAGAVTPRYERHTGSSAEPDDLLHRGSGCGEHHGEWRLAEMRQRVGLVGQDLQRFAEDRFVTGDPPETIHEPALGRGRRVHGDGTIHGKT